MPFEWLCVVVGVSLLCYGFWALVIAGIRAVGSAKKTHLRLTGHCPGCGCRLKMVVDGRCSTCGERVLHQEAWTLERELRATSRRIQQFTEDGNLDAKLKAQIDGFIAESFAELRTRQDSAVRSKHAVDESMESVESVDLPLDSEHVAPKPHAPIQPSTPHC